MNTKATYEEMPMVGALVLNAFMEDFPLVGKKYPLFTAEYIASYAKQVNKVTELEASYNVTQEMKEVTKALYKQADGLLEPIDDLKVQMKHAKLSWPALAVIINHIRSRNIEGVTMQLTSLLEFIVTKGEGLGAAGMTQEFPEELAAVKRELTVLNIQQSTLLNKRKGLVEANAAEYNALNEMTREICEAAKTFFKRASPARADAYTMTKLLAQVRATK